ncbi:MAG: carboxypeptidase regulatory-like domain-containing protein [Vicinamibacteraceae bacterium]
MMGTRSGSRPCLWLVVCALAAASVTSRAAAQEVTASVYGVVRDATGLAIPGVAVQFRSVETNRVWRAVTDDTGSYTIPSLPNGTYEGSAQLDGFNRAVVTDIVLRVNDKRRVVFVLEASDLEETVTVQADLVAVDTASGTTSSVMSGDDMRALPSVGRNVMPLAMDMPGVAGPNTSDERAGQWQSVNGIRPTHNSWLIDGGYNIDTGGNWGMPLAPNQETVAEFRAIRGNYSAEFGTGGGSTFNVITKAGSNQFSGSASWYHRNEKLMARDFFSPEIEPFRNNDIGATVGGPVIIPGLYRGRDRTFFFAFVGTRTERRDERSTSKLPEMAYRTGDFSALGTTIIDPQTGQPFPGNVIPADRIDAFARTYTDLYPQTNYSDAQGNNHTVLRPEKSDLPQLNFRVDHHFNERHRIFGRYIYENSKVNGYASPGFDFHANSSRSPRNNTVINFYSIFTPNLLNEASFTRSHNRIMNFPPLFPRDEFGLGIPELVPQTAENYPIDSLNLAAIPSPAAAIDLTSYEGFPASAFWSNYQSIFDIKNHLTWLRGPHTVKMGFDYAYEKKFEPADTNVFGAFSFDGRFTGDAYADFLLGMADSYTESSAVSFNDNRRHAFEAYVDDSWEVANRLTLNLGLRYSLFRPATEPDGRFRSFIPEAYDPEAAVTVLPTGEIPPTGGDPLNGIVDPSDHWDYTPWNFAPRLGFSYDIFGTGKTAFRGGYGRYYSREILGAFILIASNPPFQERLELENTRLSDPDRGTTGDFDFPINLSAIDPNQRIAYTDQWNVNVQQLLGTAVVLEVGYVGTRGRNMMRSRDINEGPLSADVPAGRLSANALRPYQGWGQISWREQTYASDYHGLQVGIDGRVQRNLRVKAAYTWSRTRDNAENRAHIYGASAYNNKMPDLLVGPASFDTPHRFVGSAIYQIPWLADRRDLLGAIAGGWTISTIFTAETGYPFTPTIGVDRAGIGAERDQRPVLAGDWELDDQTVDRWFNTDAFEMPAPGTLAATPRNFMRLPGRSNWDISMSKFFPLGGTAKLEARVEAFNAFNTTQFSGVGSNMSDDDFGQVTTAHSARRLQLGARLTF